MVICMGRQMTELTMGLKYSTSTRISWRRASLFSSFTFKIENSRHACRPFDLGGTQPKEPVLQKRLIRQFGYSLTYSGSNPMMFFTNSYSVLTKTQKQRPNVNWPAYCHLFKSANRINEALRLKSVFEPENAISLVFGQSPVIPTLNRCFAPIDIAPVFERIQCVPIPRPTINAPIRAKPPASWFASTTISNPTISPSTLTN